MALKQETVDYITSLAQQYGLDSKAMLEKAEKDENARKIVEDIVPRSTFSRELDKQRADNQTQFKTWQEDYYKNTVVPWGQGVSAERDKFATQAQQLAAQNAQLQAERAAYVATYGTMEGFNASAAAGGTGNPAPATIATPTNGHSQNGWLDQHRYEQDLTLARQIGALAGREFAAASSRYYSEFGAAKPFDPRAFDEFVQKGNYLQGANPDAVPRAFDRAYEDFTKDARAERDKAAYEQRLQQEVDQRVQQRMAQINMPLDNGAPGTRHGPMFGQLNPDQQADARLNDPAVSSLEKEEIQRRMFAEDIKGITAGGLLQTITAGKT